MKGTGRNVNRLGSGPELQWEKAVFCLPEDNWSSEHDCAPNQNLSLIVKETTFFFESMTHLVIQEFSSDDDQDKSGQDWDWIFKTGLIKWVMHILFLDNNYPLPDKSTYGLFEFL